MITIRIMSQFQSRSVVNNLEIMILIPPDDDTPSLKSFVRNVPNLPDEDAVVGTLWILA